jgi:HD-GYP domain-containing protein (c-di-GMP phosphodiesterase class II)
MDRFCDWSDFSSWPVQLRDTFAWKKALEAMIKIIESTIGARDPYTVYHQQRVAQLAFSIGSQIGLPEDRLRILYLAATIHDLGKIGVPEAILNKPGKLTDIEFAMIKKHPKLAFEILQPLQFCEPIVQIIVQHHERMNGSGYPHGLTGEDILLEARILGVADVVEAMSSHRPYRPSLGLDLALSEISQNKGVFYDAAVVEACFKLYEEVIRERQRSAKPRPEYPIAYDYAYQAWK